MSGSVALCPRSSAGPVPRAAGCRPWRWLVPALLCGLLLALALPAAALEGRRLALVVGNSDYAAAAPLPNAARDARDMAEALDRLGFEVTLLTDTDGAGFEAALDRVAAAAEGAESAVFYFSGHGFQLGGVNYLVPVDARLDDRVAIEREAIRLDKVIARLQHRSRQTIVLLDACRNDPLPPSVSAGLRAGLAQPETGTGTFIAFATQPNNITFDGTGSNSPFTAALLDHIETPAIPVSELMIRVRNDVARATLGRQTPWDQSSLSANFAFNPAPLQVSAPATANRSQRGELDYDFVAALPAERRRDFLGLMERSGVEVDLERLARRLLEAGEADAFVIAGLAPEARRALLDEAAEAGVDVPLAAVAEGLTARGTVDYFLLAAMAAPERARAVDAARAFGLTVEEERLQLAMLAPQPGAPLPRIDPSPEPAPPDDPFAHLVPQRLSPVIPERRRITGVHVEEEEPAPDNLAVAVQEELARLNCYRMAIDGDFGPGSQGALRAFFTERGEPVPAALDPTEEIWRLLRQFDEQICPDPPAPRQPVSQPPRTGSPQTPQQTVQEPSPPEPQGGGPIVVRDPRAIRRN